MYCKRCGAKIDTDSLFCNKCGTSVKENVEQNTDTYKIQEEYEKPIGTTRMLAGLVISFLQLPILALCMLAVVNIHKNSMSVIIALGCWLGVGALAMTLADAWKRYFRFSIAPWGIFLPLAIFIVPLFLMIYWTICVLVIGIFLSIIPVTVECKKRTDILGVTRGQKLVRGIIYAVMIIIMMTVCECICMMA